MRKMFRWVVPGIAILGAVFILVLESGGVDQTTAQQFEEGFSKVNRAEALEPEFDTTSIRRIVRQGENQYRPGYPLGFERTPRKVLFFLRTDSTQWYDPTQLGADGADWLKIGGIYTFSFFRFSSWSPQSGTVLGAFRCDTIPGGYEVAGYINDRDQKHRVTESLKVPPNGWAMLQYDYYMNGAIYQIWTNEKKYLSGFLPDFSPWPWSISAPAWHGGSLPSPTNHYIYTNLTTVK